MEEDLLLMKSLSTKRIRYEFGSPRKGKVLVIPFPDEATPDCYAVVNAYREKIEASFKNIGYEPDRSIGGNLNRIKRADFLKDLKRVADNLLPSESFAMVIKCSQKDKELRMTSGDTFKMEEVYCKFYAESCKSLRCRPKFFVFDTHPYNGAIGYTHLNGRDNIPGNIPVMLPNESDMLVIYSFEGKEGNSASTSMVSQNPSFMDVFTKVLEDDFKKENGHASITDLMLMVSNKVNNQIGQEKPLAVSTLRSRYYLK